MGSNNYERRRFVDVCWTKEPPSTGASKLMKQRLSRTLARIEVIVIGSLILLSIVTGIVGLLGY